MCNSEMQQGRVRSELSRKGINGQELLDFSFGGVRTTEDSVHIWKETSLNDTCLDYSSTFQRICEARTEGGVV